MNEDSSLFYACSLVEFMGRATKNRRSDLIAKLGKDINRIYSHADVFHCEPIEKVADDFIVRNDIQQGEYDNVGIARYEVPGYWDVGKVFERLIEDVSDEYISDKMRIVCTVIFTLLWSIFLSMSFG